MKSLEFTPSVVFQIGPVTFTQTVVETWIVMAVLIAFFYFISRHLSIFPSLLQGSVESLIEAAYDLVSETVGGHAWTVVPLIGTLWIFIGVNNLIGLVPGFKSPSCDINSTFAFATVSYLSIHFYGIKFQGLKKYLAQYAKPSILFLPMHLIADLSRTLSLSIRLFGNMLSGEIIAAILMVIAGLLIPVPMGLLHVLIGIVQAYVFGALTLAFIAGAVEPE